MRSIALLLVLAFLAGCAEPKADAADPAGPSQPRPSGTPLSFAGCVQFHTAFPARGEDFASILPEGFEPRLDEAGLAQLQVIANACQAGGDSLLVRLPVLPPADLADPAAAHYLAIEAYAEAGIIPWTTEQGLALFEACQCTAELAADGPVLADSFVSQGQEDQYDLRTALTASSGEFAAYRAVLYVAEEGKAVLRLLEDGAASSNRGLGTVALAYQGPGGAPPLTPGEAAHVVQGLSMTWSVEDLRGA